jgi:putative (di)nucleoside polyphosphate hydrolase
MTQSDHNISLLPYRLGVGMMILNKHNQVFVGKRVDAKVEAWQMPQGGIDIGETPSRAALREMEEEIGTKNGNIVSETKNWYSYDLPKFLIPKLWHGQYKGQKQKWFLINFTGEDSEIEVETNHPEFEDWRWVDLVELTEIIIPFKRKLYEAVMSEFKPLLRI